MASGIGNAVDVGRFDGNVLVGGYYVSVSGFGEDLSLRWFLSRGMTRASTMMDWQTGTT